MSYLKVPFLLSVVIIIGCQESSKEVNCFEGVIEGPDPGCTTVVINPGDTIFAKELYLIRIIGNDTLVGISTPSLPEELKLSEKHIFFRLDESIKVNTICNHLFGITYPFAIITNVHESPCHVINP